MGDAQRDNPIVMGGSFANDPAQLTPEWQAVLAPDTRDNKVGFVSLLMNKFCFLHQ